MNQTTLILSAAILAGLLPSSGAVIALYEFTNALATGNNPNEAQAETVGGPLEGDYFEADDVSTNATAGGFTSGPGVNPIIIASTDVMFASEGQGMSDGGVDDMQGAVAAGDYFGFTVNADVGFELGLTSLTFDIGRALRGTQDYAVRSNVDGFAENIVFANDVIPLDTLAPQLVDLSGAAYQGLESIELRIYFDDRVNNSPSSSATYIDNVQLNGDVTAIPEPSSSIILGLAAALSVLRRRRA